MSRKGAQSAKTAKAAFLLLALAQAQTPGPKEIARGSAIFASKCGIGYCHGQEGKAGRGPRLAGRKFDRDYLVRTVSAGVGNSLMPAFKDQLSSEEIRAVVAYILSLSGGSALAASSPAAAAPEARGPAARVSSDAGDPEAGRALFFDASNPKHCSVCHRHQGRGADVGPDLTSQAARPAREIWRDIVDPDARLAVEPVTVVTKTGQRITGIKAQENRELLRIYDTASLPPVLRTIYKDQIERTEPERHSPMPGDYGTLFTGKQLLDLVAFLKGAVVAPAEVE